MRELVLQQADRTLSCWVTEGSQVVTVYCVRGEWKLCDSDPVCVQQWPCLYTSGDSLSLKQTHYKVDMTSVNPAIITGQDSWPLPVMVHVAIRRNATHWLAAESRSKSCFIMPSIVSDSKGFFSCCKLAGVFFFKRKPEFMFFCNFSMPPLVESHKKQLYVSSDVNHMVLVTYETISSILDGQINPRFSL